MSTIKKLFRKFGTVEPPQTHVKELQLPRYLCNNVVREGSRRVKGVELSQTSASSTPSFPSKDVFIKGSIQLNHPELI